MAHRDQRCSSVRTVSSLHFGILFFSASHSSRHLLIPKLFKLLIFSSRPHLDFFQLLITSSLFNSKKRKFGCLELLFYLILASLIKICSIVVLRCEKNCCSPPLSRRKLYPELCQGIVDVAISSVFTLNSSDSSSASSSPYSSSPSSTFTNNSCSSPKLRGPLHVGPFTRL